MTAGLTTHIALVGLGFQTQDPASADPEAVRKQIGRIMERKEFSYEKSLLERLIEWILKQLGRLVPPVQPKMTGGGPGIWAIFMATLLIAAALAVVVFAIIRLRRRAGRSDNDDEDDTISVHLRPNEPADEWLEEALALEAAGEWKQSVLLRYRRLVGELADRKLVETVPGRTPGELRRDLGSSMPGSSELFGEANRIFEDPWYADEPTGAEQVARLERITEALLASSGAPKGPAASGDQVSSDQGGSR